MDAELLVTGDEVMRGDVTDTNTVWLRARLLQTGVRVRRVVQTGDDPDDIGRALAEAAARTQLLVVSGGMGPTSDDRTVECAAKVAGAALVEDAATLERIRARWAQRARPEPPGVRRQAMVPAGATVLENDAGTAPGLRMRVGSAECFLFAGVPREFRHLCERHLLPFVAGRTGRAFATETLRFVLVPESDVDVRLLPVAQRHAVMLGLRASFPDTLAVLTAEGRNGEEASDRLSRALAEARQQAGAGFYGTGDGKLPAVVGRMCAAAHALVAVAESCTGGGLGKAITSVPGSSAWFAGGVVAYANEEKTRALGVSPDLIAAHGAVSEAVARAMAEGALARVRGDRAATHALSITGIAGPDGGTEDKPVGMVWIALAGPRGTRAHVLRFGARDRGFVRAGAVAAALDLLRRELSERP